MSFFGDLFSAGLGYLASSETNATNAKLARQAQAFQAQQAGIDRHYAVSMFNTAAQFNRVEAQTQRDWQERMAGSSYQRAVADLAKAGMNPMLAYAQGGAQTPSGATASTSGGYGGHAAKAVVPQYRSPLSAMVPAVGAVAEIARTKAGTQLTKAQTEVEQARRLQVEADTRQKVSSAKNLDMSSLKMVTEIDKLKEQVSQTIAETAHTTVKQYLAQEQIQLTRVQAELEQKRITAVEAQAKLTEIQSRLGELSVPKAEQEAKMHRSEYGEKRPYIQDASQFGRGLMGKVFKR